MKKLHKWVVVIVIGVSMGVGTILPIQANNVMISNQAGSINDPIVTKSYVDQQVKSIIKDELSRQTSNTAGTSSSLELTVVTVPKGKVLYAGVGTEFIVRTGEAIAFSNDGNGIPDLTAGQDVSNGAVVDKNHLLLFPREGRGVKPNSVGGIIVMVRGSYLLLDETSSATP